MLKDERGLDERKESKLILDEEDSKEVLRCYWVTDTNRYPEERQRVQIATLSLFAAYSGTRPYRLLSLKYKDLGLFVQRSSKTDEAALTLLVALTKTEGRSGSTEPCVTPLRHSFR